MANRFFDVSLTSCQRNPVNRNVCSILGLTPSKSANRKSLTMSALSSPILFFPQILCHLFFFFEHTTAFTPKSGLFVWFYLWLDDHGSLTNLFNRLQSDLNISAIRTSTMISNSNSLCREQDAQSHRRRSTSRHFRFRAVPRTNRTLMMANTHNHSATSSTTEPPAGVPSLPWQCFCFDASPDEHTDVASQDECALLLGPLPPTRSATRNCLAC